MWDGGCKLVPRTVAVGHTIVDVVADEGALRAEMAVGTVI